MARPLAVAICRGGVRMSSLAAEIRSYERAYRGSCRMHAKRRIRERRCPLPLVDIEILCWRMRRCFLVPGQDRYTLRLRRRRGEAWRVVWDMRLRCVVTVFEV